MNKIILIGNLGRDPELAYTPNGTANVKFSVATTEHRTVNGVKEEETTWHYCVAWRELAETISKYLSKGSKVYVEGKLKKRKYTDKSGNEKEAVEVDVRDIEFLTPKAKKQEEENNDLGEIEDHPF